MATISKMRAQPPASPGMTHASKARLLLAVACMWPLFLVALFASSTQTLEEESVQLLNTKSELSKDVRFNIRKVLDRVDVMGYGPTHPRVGFVVVGDDKDRILSTVESVFRTTDRDRIFVVCVVVDGKDQDKQLVDALEKFDDGAVPHWHGLRAEMHAPGEESIRDDHSQSRKIHVLFNPEVRGMAESRADAVQFIHLLSEKHEQSGIKSPQEDILLTMIQSGVELTSRRWLTPVTGALVVPPPMIGTNEDEDKSSAMKLANAIVFNVEGPGKRTSFDTTFTAVLSEPSATDLNLSGGASYPTPAWNGAAIAMRLETYLNLPAQDYSLKSPWSANLDLSLNLWLCADGMDMMDELYVKPIERIPQEPLQPDMAARFAAAWMDDVTTNRFFHAYAKTFQELTHLQWETLLSKARSGEAFPKDLTERCRSFSWYAELVNPDLTDLLQTKEETEEEKQAQGALKNEADNAVHEIVAIAAVPEHNVVKADKLDVKLDVAEPIKENVQDTNESPVDQHDAGDQREKPSVPLRPNNLEIVQKARTIDISFVDVSHGNDEDPHRGAKDEDGNWGYKHDEKALRKNPPSFAFDPIKLERACKRRDNDYNMLTKRVYVDFQSHRAAERSGMKRDKIFCLVYTTESGHGRIPAIRETWGQKCDGFMVGSTKTDRELGTVEIPHEGAEEYGNIWQKVRSMWSYIYDNYYEEYDWFHIGGDDLFLIVENLRLYLESEEIKTAANGGVFLPQGNESHQVPLFLGRRFAYQGDMQDIFISGGSGYTMNKAALKTLVVEGFPNYFPHAHTFSEDTMTARVFRKFDVYPYDTKDQDGGERYMPFTPGNHWGYRMPADHSKDWYARYSINVKEGPEHCSPKSVAFHYIKDDMMYRLFALLYNKCPAP